MTIESRGAVLTLPYAGLRGLGPVRGFALWVNRPATPQRWAPARRMNDAARTQALLTAITAEHSVGAYADLVREQVTDDRFSHIVRVAGLALRFAEANGFSAQQRGQVAQAAILHDAARDLPADQMMRLAPPTIELERSHPLALHGRAGRALAASWGVTDQVVLDAVEGHVFGVSQDDPVGMAVYVADVSEEGRGVNEQIRELAMTDLRAAYQLAVRAKVYYLRHAGKQIHPDTLATFNALVGPEGGPSPEPSTGAGGPANSVNPAGGRP